MIALEQHPPVFAFAVTPALVAEGVASAMAMGIVGTMWPAWRATCWWRADF
jgi:hypothetical protein